MAHILKNEQLEVHVDLPKENYNFSRFDWTGKIVKAIFHNIDIGSIERTDDVNKDHYGKGFYNEFGIDTALGFEETEIGGWFHKIGVGLLKKEEDEYLFHKKYEIKPAKFKIITESNKIVITCISESSNGYAYILKKEIAVQKNSFTSTYYLQNTGEKDISTTEYVHNFMAINNDLIGENYLLKFPFQLTPQLFGATVNPKQKVAIGENEITFKSPSKEQFFFSNLSGDQHIEAKWELLHLTSNIGISETGSFRTNKVNLWGWEHVVSPELFHTIFLEPGESTKWSRTYTLFKGT
jgi:hypothetical protein